MLKFQDIASLTVDALREVKEDARASQEELGGLTEEEQRDKKMKEHVKDMIDNSSFHGINYIVDERYPIRRLIWLVITFSFLVYSMQKVYESTMEYLEYPFATAIMRRHVEEMKFPAVSFCNLNDIRKSIVNGTRLDHAAKTANKTLFSMLTEEEMKILERTPHELDEMLVECIFNGEPCSHKNFTTFYWQQGDRCFSFNSGKPGHDILSVQGTGVHKSLMLTINIQHYDYYRDTANAGNGGIRLIIHGQDETPVRYTGIHVQPGFATHISMDRKKIKNLKAPYKTRCGDRKLKYFRSYSMDTCWLEDLTDYVLKECNCRLQFMPGNSTVCDGNVTWLAWKKWENFNRLRLYDCPLPCEIESYHASTSRSLFPSADYSYELKRKMELHTHMRGIFSTVTDVKRFMRDNLLRVILFYEDLSYELQEQQPSYDLTFFLGDIGGQIGLFIGAGAMSYFEFIDCLGMVLYTRFFERFLSTSS